MAIIDVEKEIAKRKQYLSELGEIQSRFPDIQNHFLVKLVNLVESEKKIITKEISDFEFSIVNKKKNCSICIWSSFMGGTIMCDCFASKYNGQFIEKNTANRCRLFEPIEGMFEKRDK